MVLEKRGLDISSLEGWLWEAACAVRGSIDAPKFKDYILPLIFVKRLSDVLEDELAALTQSLGSRELAEDIARQDHSVVSTYVPPDFRWEQVAKRTTKLGEYLTDVVRAVATENPRLAGVINIVDFNATTAGQRIVGDQQLTALVKVLSRYRLGIDDVEPDLLGRAYEYLLRKFAEGQGQSAGEFYTPREVGVLIARLIDPAPGLTVYDPTVGSAGLLIKAHLRLLERYGERDRNGRLMLPANLPPVEYFGQEYNAATYALAHMNAALHGMRATIRLGDTMNHPAFTESAGGLKHFDLVVANPMWNQDFPTKIYEADTFDRFQFGAPPASSADWGWVQHMLASLTPHGRLAVVLDTGSVSRGSGNTGSNRERDIRRIFVSGDTTTPGDLIEAVILLPENLFYNTTAPGVILIINRAKRYPGEILLVNASSLFVKGRPKNYLTDAHIQQVAALYLDWRVEAGISAIATVADVARHDYNLSPSRYVANASQDETLPLEEAVVRLREAEEERAAADQALHEVLIKLGLGGLFSAGAHDGA